MRKKLVLVQQGTLWKNIQTNLLAILDVSLKDVFKREGHRQFEYSKDGKNIYLLISPKKKRKETKN